MGVGMPDELPEYVARGVDMMDCVLPSRNARNGYLFTSEGRVIIKQARYRDDPCPSTRTALATPAGPIRAPTCAICFWPGRSFSLRWPRLHNLKHYLDIMRQIRQAILLGSFRPFWTASAAER